MKATIQFNKSKVDQQIADLNKQSYANKYITMGDNSKSRVSNTEKPNPKKSMEIKIDMVKGEKQDDELSQ